MMLTEKLIEDLERLRLVYAAKRDRATTLSGADYWDGVVAGIGVAMTELRAARVS